MTAVLAVAGVAFAVALALTPIARQLALRIGLTDEGAGRVPLLGGAAVFLAFLAGTFFGADILFGRSTAIGGVTDPAPSVAIYAGATWVFVWGLWDDLQRISPATKLGIQVVAAVVVLIGGIAVRLPLPEVANVTLTLLWMVGITNAFNLLDNTDGLATGTAGVVAGFCVVLAVANSELVPGVLAAAVLGASLGFLIFNSLPATIFLGDSGSLLLGFLLAVTGIELRFPSNVPWVTWMVPILLLGVPIFDTTLVFVSRLRRRRNPLTSPGRDHLSHRLLAKGWTPRRSVLLHYALAALFGLLAVVVSLRGVVVATAVGSGVLVVGVVVLVRLDREFGDEASSLDGV